MGALEELPSIPRGKYRHFKGNAYTVLGVVRHSETLQPLVLYRQEYGDRSLWVRPFTMFLEQVQTAGGWMTRFRREETPAAVPEEKANLYQNLPAALPEEITQTLLNAEHVRLERIVSHGHASPEGFWYDQDQHEWVVVLKGAARLRFEKGAAIEMRPGDCLNIPAHTKHRVEWTTAEEPTIWLAVHYGEK